MAGEKQQEADRREDAWHDGAGGFEFNVGTDDSAEEQERGEERDPLREDFEPGRLDLDDGPRIQARLLADFIDVLGDPRGQDRAVPDDLHRLLRAQREERALGVDDLVADFDFLVEVHEPVHQLGMVAVQLRHAAEIPGVVGNDLRVHRGGDLLAGTHDRCRRPDRADGSHEDFFCSEGDEGTGRARVRVDIRVNRHRALHQHLHDLLGRLERPAGRIHVQNQRRGPGGLGLFQHPAQEEKLRFGDRALDRQHDDGPFFNRRFRCHQGHGRHGDDER